VDPEVFEVLTERGRVSARAFLSELDRLIDTASGSRVTAADALCLVADERKEYGSDFVEAFAARRPVEALRILERLLSGREFTVFRPWGREEEPPGRKGPRGDAAFFPLLGLLAGEVRRMLALKAGLLDRGLVSPPRLDYRAFADRLLPALKAPRPGLPAFPLDVHPLLLHKAYLASEAWSLGELSRTLVELERIDRGVKSGAGTGLELLGGFLLARAGPAGTPPPKNP